MTSCKEVRNQLLISHNEGLLNDHELLLLCDLRMYVREKQADMKNVGRRGSADLHHIYVA